MEGRRCFATCRGENLLTGALFARSLARRGRCNLQKVYAYFPRLKTAARLGSRATPPAAEQQMTAIGGR